MVVLLLRMVLPSSTTSALGRVNSPSSLARSTYVNVIVLECVVFPLIIWNELWLLVDGP